MRVRHRIKIKDIQYSSNFRTFDHPGDHLGSGSYDARLTFQIIDIEDINMDVCKFTTIAGKRVRKGPMLLSLLAVED